MRRRGHQRGKYYTWPRVDAEATCLLQQEDEDLHLSMDEGYPQPYAGSSLHNAIATTKAKDA